MYRYYIEGFSGECSTLDQLRDRVRSHNRNGSLTGKTLKIWKGQQYGDCTEYRARPDREIVV